MRHEFRGVVKHEIKRLQTCEQINGPNFKNFTKMRHVSNKYRQA